MKKTNISKIAIFRALQLGDMLTMIPAVRALRTAYPTAEITLIGLPWVKEFAKRFDAYFDTYIAFPGYEGLPEQKAADAKIFNTFLKKVQQKQFDLVLQMQGNGIIANSFITSFGGKVTAGSNVAEAICPDKNTFTYYRDDLPEIERNLRVIEKLGIPSQGAYLEFPISENEKKELAHISQYAFIKKQPYICIHPGARDPQRIWNPKYFAFVADTLHTLGYEIVLTGVAEEKEIIEAVIKNMKYQPINLAGKLSLGATAALIEKAKLIVSNCTAISHIADALRVPSVIVYLTSDVNRWAPLDEILHKRVTNKNADQPFTVLIEAMKVLKLKSAKEEKCSNEQKGILYGAI